MAHNGLQVCIVDGDKGYIFSLTDNNFQVITHSYFKPSAEVYFDNGKFMFRNPIGPYMGGQYFWSAPYNGLIGDGKEAIISGSMFAPSEDWEKVNKPRKRKIVTPQQHYSELKPLY